MTVPEAGKLKVLDLFSGIGGFSLGLERTGGFETVAFCEINAFCRRVLAKHWPGIPIYEDVRELTGERLAADGICVDVMCGGFPCQDISIAGKGAGLSGERSGLWREYARIIGELRPSFIIVENVSALLARGLDAVLGELAALRYDAEWHCIPAAAVGAGHLRDRIWIVAYPQQESIRDEPRRWCGASRKNPTLSRNNGKERLVANADTSHSDRRHSALQMGWGAFASETIDAYNEGRIQWPIEPGVGRVVHGVPYRVDRCGALGNAVVPQIPELIGKAIIETLEGGPR